MSSSRVPRRQRQARRLRTVSFMDSGLGFKLVTLSAAKGLTRRHEGGAVPKRRRAERSFASLRMTTKPAPEQDVQLARAATTAPGEAFADCVVHGLGTRLQACHPERSEGPDSPARGGSGAEASPRGKILHFVQDDNESCHPERSEGSGFRRTACSFRPTSACPSHAIRRSTISFLISAIALAGLRPFGQVRVQFMMVWQR